MKYQIYTLNDRGKGDLSSVQQEDIKLLVDNTNNFIPLTGTEVGRPITGDLEVFNTFQTKVLNDDEVSYNSVKLQSADVQLIINGFDLLTITSLSHNSFQLSSNNPDFKGITAETDLSEQISDLDYPQKIYTDKQHSYSTDEINTGGKWIDGKPIYRKVIPFTLTDGVAVINTSTLGLNVDTPIDKKVSLSSIDGRRVTEFIRIDVPFIKYLQATFEPDVDDIYIKYLELNLGTGTVIAFDPSASGNLTIEYTKTTD